MKLALGFVALALASGCGAWTADAPPPAPAGPALVYVSARVSPVAPPPREVLALERRLRDSLRALVGNGRKPGIGASLEALRQAHVDVRVRATGEVLSEFVELEDSLSERLLTHVGHGAASADWQREVAATERLRDVKMGFGDVWRIAIEANRAAQHGAFETAANAAKGDASLEQVVAWLVTQRRREHLASQSLAVVATFQRVLHEGRGFADVESAAREALAALERHEEPTVEHARAYVREVAGGLGLLADYENRLRRTWGNTHYEAHLRPVVENCFAARKAASNASGALGAASASLDGLTALQQGNVGAALRAARLMGGCTTSACDS